MQEVRRPDGTLEMVCAQCQAKSRCQLCGYSSKEPKDFGVRKINGKWRVLCQKCIEGQGGPSGPGRAGRRGRGR